MYPPYTTQNLITVSGFKARNPEVDVTPWNDTTISGFISSATASMQQYCEVDGFLTTTVSGERGRTVITPAGDLIIYPRVRPIQQGSVAAIRLVKGGFSTSLTISSNGTDYYQVPYPYTYLNYPSSYLAGTGTLMIGGSQQLITLKDANTYYEIDYTGGLSSTPPDLQDACDLWVRDILIRRLNPMAAQEVRQGSFSFSRQIRSSAGKGDMIDSIWIQQAKQKLDDGGYRRTALGV